MYSVFIANTIGRYLFVELSIVLTNMERGLSYSWKIYYSNLLLYWMFATQTLSIFEGSVPLWIVFITIFSHRITIWKQFWYFSAPGADLLWWWLFVRAVISTHQLHLNTLIFMSLMFDEIGVMIGDFFYNHNIYSHVNYQTIQLLNFSILLSLISVILCWKDWRCLLTETISFLFVKLAMFDIDDIYEVILVCGKNAMHP